MLVQWLTIKWSNARQILLPPHVLSVDLAEISYEESIFIARLAVLMIDTFDPLLQSSPNKLLGGSCAIDFSILSLRKFEVFFS